MIFDTPLMLGLAPLVALALAVFAWTARGRRIKRARAWSEAVARAAQANGRWGPVALGLTALAAAAALAGPRGGRANVRSESRALNLVLAVDISKSMLAEDVAPSRLRRAVREARRLVQDLRGDRIGLIAFSGKSYILSPLTVDGSAITLLLDALDPDVASQGSTSVGSALSQGGQLLGASSELADRVLVVFTDGESHDSLEETLAEARALIGYGVRLVMVGEGGSQPARIPVRDDRGTLIEYQQTEDGIVIETRRRDDVLQQIVSAAEGTLVHAQLPDQAGAVRDLLGAFKRGPAINTSTADLLPLGWVPLLAAVVILATHTLTRRGAALVGLAGVVLAPGFVSAQIPSRGERALASKRPARAAAEFLREARSGNAPDTAFYNAGTAALQAEQWAVARGALLEAARSLDPSLRYRALYNLGLLDLLAAERDSSAREGLLEEAQRHLREALLLEPGSARAKWNLELALRRRPPMGGGTPPPTGGGGPSEQEESSAQPPASGGLSPSQAEQILNSVEREEQASRIKQSAKPKKSTGVRIKDW